MTQASGNFTKRVGDYEIDVRGKGRQFKSDTLEKFSHCHGLVPLFLYSPFVVLCFVVAVVSYALPFTTIFALAAAGAAFWTLFEYWMHREVFHWRGIEKVHYFLHGIHHMYPNDKGRQVMPPGASLVVAIPIWFLMQAIFGTATALPLFGGFLGGYVWYDTTHFWTHVGKAKSRYGKYLKKHHMLHHFKSHQRGFGVSTPMWDWVFRTMPERDAND